MFATTSVQAQTPKQQEELRERQEQFQRQEQEKLRLEELNRRYRELEPPQSQDRKTKALPADNLRCVDVEDIRFEGVSILDEAMIDSIAGRFRQRCLGINDIRDLLEAINSVYFSEGYVTSRAFLRNQDMEAGVIFITVLEGRVEQLSGKDGHDLTNSELFFAFPMGKGKLLNLRDIEQGLDQMNRLASNNATMEIVPGMTPGTSRIVVNNDPDKRFRFELGRNNGGNRSTGLLKNRLSADLENLAKLNESIHLSLERSAHGYSNKRRSRSLTGHISVPFGYWMAGYSGSYNSYGTLVKASVQDFLTSGTSRHHKGTLSHILHRDQMSKTRLDIGLTVKRNRNFIEDILIKASSRRLTVGSLTLSRSQRLWGGVLLVYVVVALPCSNCPIVPPVLMDQYKSVHHTSGPNTDVVPPEGTLIRLVTNTNGDVVTAMHVPRR